MSLTLARIEGGSGIIVVVDGKNNCRSTVCPIATLEDGFEKVAVYHNDEGYTHAALQLADGKWTSKLGDYEDIRHESFDALYGDSEDEYGKLFCIMKRKRDEEQETQTPVAEKKTGEPSPRNKAIHIPLDIEKAVVGLMKVKPKKPPEST